MRTLSTAILALLAAALLCSGCSRTIGGPRFWWDDRNQERLGEEYQLPADPGAPSEEGGDKKSLPSGEDLSGDNLRDYRDNLDQKEERRKGDSSLLDF